MENTVDSNDTRNSDNDEKVHVQITSIEEIQSETEEFPNIYLWSNIKVSDSNEDGCADNKNISKINEDMSEINGNVCEIYEIENDELNNNDDAAYIINGECFKYRYRPSKEYQTVNVFAERLSPNSITEFNDSDTDDYSARCSDENVDDGDVIGSDKDAPLKMSLQKVPHGIIINDNVYLTDNQWNTLYLCHSTIKCFVCGELCDLEDTEHILSDRHIHRLALCKPLERFDLSITRQISNVYHCGVCNEVYNEGDINDHNDSKSHETNQLFYINKASDVIFDRSSQDKISSSNDCYHFNALNEIHYESCNSGSYTTNESDNDSEYNGNECEDNANNDDKNKDNGNEFMGMSYAAMTKKAKVANLPKYVFKVYGNKRFKVTSDSWHMILNLKGANFYCMVCKFTDKMIVKSKHCLEYDHNYNLNNCAMLEGYNDFLIRQVDNKVVHCAHCNNLEYKYQIDLHLLRRHRRFSASTPRETPPTSQPGNVNPTNDTTNNGNGNDINGNISNESSKLTSDCSGPETRSTINDVKINNYLYSSVPVVFCGLTMKLKLISLHVICLNLNTFYCGLCDKTEAKVNLMHHIASLTHKQLYNLYLFIKQYGCHMIREIRGAYHCSLCNIPITKDAVLLTNHIRNFRHWQNFNEALGNKIHLLGNNVNNKPLLQHVDQHKSTDNTALGINQHNLQHVEPQNRNVSLENSKQNVPLSVEQLKLNPGNNQHTLQYVEQQILNTALRTNQHVSQHIDQRNIDTVSENKHKMSHNIVQDAKTNAVKTIETSDLRTGVYDSATIDNAIGEKDNAVGENDNNATCENDNANGETNDTDTFTTAANDTDTNLTGSAMATNKNMMMDGEITQTDDKDDSFEFNSCFDVDAKVYVKLKGYIQITLTSYNSLVAIGSGARFCFICQQEVEFEDMKRHVDSRSHKNNMGEYKFLKKYDYNLIRQYYLTYHCGICNIILFRSELLSHLKWPPHLDIIEKNITVSKNHRKHMRKSGMPQYVVSLQEEQIFLNVMEPKIKYHYSIIINDTCDVVKKNKIIIVKDIVWKIQWDAWNSLLSTSTIKGLKCVMCKRELRDEGYAHVNNDVHKKLIADTFLERYYPSLIRKIDNDLLNCVICNNEVPFNANVIDKHLNGKRHLKNYDQLIKNSSMVNAYENCDEDVLTLY